MSRANLHLPIRAGEVAELPRPLRGPRRFGRGPLLTASGWALLLGLGLACAVVVGALSATAAAVGRLA